MPSLSKPQFEFLSDNQTPELVFSGGMGAGKSMSGALKAIDLATINPGGIGIIWGPTLRDAKDGIMRAILQMLRGEHDSGFHFRIPYDYNKSTGALVLWVNGRKRKASEIVLRSAEQNIVGTNASWAIADELDTISTKDSRSNWLQLIQRVRDKAAPHKQLCATTTPEGRKFLYEYFVQEVEAFPELKNQRRLITASTLTNPGVEDSYIRNLMLSHTPEGQRARIHGEFTALATGRVYPYFERETHHTNKVLDDYPAATLFIGMDFNTIFMAATVCVQLPGKLLVLREHIGTRENPIHDTPAMIRLLKQEYPGRHIIVCPDASGTQHRSENYFATNISMLEDAGFGIMKFGANGSVEKRIVTVNSMLYNTMQEKGDQLLVNTKYCPLLTKGLEHQEIAADGKPDKKSGFDHCFVGSTLVHTETGLLPIAALVGTEGRVYGVDNKLVPYLNARLTQRAATVVEVCLSDDTTIRCTPDHRFLTTTGWVQAADLAGHALINRLSSTTEHNLCKSYPYLPLSKNLMAKSSTNLALTSTPIGLVASDDYTALCGNSTTAQFQKDTTFTTSITTPPTTTLKTLSAYRLLTTAHITQHAPLQMDTPGEDLRSVSEHYAPLQSGTGLKKVASGTQKWLQKLLGAFLHTAPFITVSSVAKPSLHSAQQAEPVVRHAGSEKLLVCKEVRAVTTVEDVYCLEVPEHHSFAVGHSGVIAHNCNDALGYVVMQTFGERIARARNQTWRH